MEISKSNNKTTDTVLLRKLAMKSRLKFGDNAHLTVEDVFRAGRQADIVWAYYNLPQISFVDEVLDKLGIEANERIAKPGKDIDLGLEVAKRLEMRRLEQDLVGQKDRFINHFVPKTDANQPLN